MLIFFALTKLFLQKKVLKGGDSRYFWNINGGFSCKKSALWGIYSHIFGTYRGRFAGV